VRIIHFLTGRCNPESANGVDKCVYHLSKEQAREHDLFVFSLTRKEPIAIKGVEVRAFSPSRNPLGIPRPLRDALLAVRPDVVHLHSVFIPQQAALAGWLWRRGIRYVHTPHGGLSPLSLRRRRIRKWLFRHVLERGFWNHAAFVHAVNDLEIAYVRSYGIKCPVVLAPHGIDAGELPDPSTLNPNFLAECFPQIEGKRVFLYLGRLDPLLKGLDLLLDACAQIRSAVQNACVVIAGPDWRGQRRSLEQKAKDLGLTELVLFVGPKYGKEKFDILSSCDVFVHPSRSEGFPFAVLEALGIGKPCLVSTALGFTDFFLQNAVGVSVEPSVEGTTKGIRTLLALPKDRLQRMGVNARAASLREFNWQKSAQLLCEAYAAYR
jgi:glycosyltransferase involved in cell wall biosynthesis